MKLPGKKHLRRRIAGSEQVFEQVRGVVPTSANVDRRSAGRRPVGRAAVVLMTFGIQPGIVAASLLAHEFQQDVGQGPENIVADAKGKRTTLPDDETVPPRAAERGKVELGQPSEFRPAFARQETGPPLPSFPARVGVDHAESAVEVAVCEGDGVLQIGRLVADLASAEKDLIALRGIRAVAGQHDRARESQEARQFGHIASATARDTSRGPECRRRSPRRRAA
jgi:hypothetical protein